MVSVSEADPFYVNLRDPDDIAEKLSVAKTKLADIEERLRDLRPLETDAADWRETIAFLEGKIGPTNGVAQTTVRTTTTTRTQTGTDESSGPSVVDLAVGVVDREVRSISGADVFHTLRREGHDVTRVGVRNALYYAAHRVKRIRSAFGRGMYAPLAYIDPNEPQTPLGQQQEAMAE